MANQEDVDRIVDRANQTEDVAQLKAYAQELRDISAQMAQAYASSTDSAMQADIAQIRDSAEYGAEEVGARARQLEIDQMDPNYEQRKAEREQHAAEQKAREQQEAAEARQEPGELLHPLGGGEGGEGGGLGGMLGGLFGGGGGGAAGGAQGQAAPVGQTAAPGAAPAGVACPSCGQMVEGSPKFCPHCGSSMPAPAPASVPCASCGQPIEGSPKFCPNCGAPTA